MHNFKFKAVNVLVVGDIMLDNYLWGKCNRISPEAPIQIVDIERESSVLGGAGNVISNLVSLGAKICALGVLGRDTAAEEVIKILKNLNVDFSGIQYEDTRPTTQKSRIVASNQQVLRFDYEHKNHLDQVSEDHIISFVEKHIHSFDIIIFSDYGKGVLSETICQKIIGLANKNGKKVLVDPKGTDYAKYKGAFSITPNRKEAAEATSLQLNNDENLQKSMNRLKTDLNLDYAIVTLSEEGIALYDDKLQKFKTKAQAVTDVTGAGDTVIASLAFCLANGFSMEEAIEFANAAAAVVVAKIGSATATVQEVFEYFNKNAGLNFDIKIVGTQQLDQIITQLKKLGKKIVFTNGCFDVLHFGHVKYLDQAKQLGDVLVVGVNSDRTVKMLKGNDRPINHEKDRLAVIAALASVDFVCLFDEETPIELIKLVKPDVLTKGKDYEGKEVIGSDIAQETILIDFAEGRSTTAILTKIKGR